MNYSTGFLLPLRKRLLMFLINFIPQPVSCPGCLRYPKWLRISGAFQDHPATVQLMAVTIDIITSLRLCFSFMGLLVATAKESHYKRSAEPLDFHFGWLQETLRWQWRGTPFEIDVMNVTIRPVLNETVPLSGTLSVPVSPRTTRGCENVPFSKNCNSNK